MAAHQGTKNNSELLRFFYIYKGMNKLFEIMSKKIFFPMVKA